MTTLRRLIEQCQKSPTAMMHAGAHLTRGSRRAEGGARTRTFRQREAAILWAAQGDGHLPCDSGDVSGSLWDLFGISPGFLLDLSGVGPGPIPQHARGPRSSPGQVSRFLAAGTTKAAAVSAAASTMGSRVGAAGGRRRRVAATRSRRGAVTVPISCRCRAGHFDRERYDGWFEPCGRGLVSWDHSSGDGHGSKGPVATRSTTSGRKCPESARQTWNVTPRVYMSSNGTVWPD